jgi:hypothetical protein
MAQTPVRHWREGGGVWCRVNLREYQKKRVAEAKVSYGMVRGWLQDPYRMVTGWLQDGVRMTGGDGWSDAAAMRGKGMSSKTPGGSIAIPATGWFSEHVDWSSA